MKIIEVPYSEVYPKALKWGKRPYPMPISYNAVNDSYTFNQDAYDAWLTSIGEKAPKPVEVLEVKPGKCDCGSESAGSMRHSTWCSAYEK